MTGVGHPSKRPASRTHAFGQRALPVRRPRAAAGILASLAAVALATAAIAALKQVAPVISLSVVYLPAVLLVSTYWGISLGLFCSLLSAAAFNFFHVPPTGRFTIARAEDWVAFVAFVIVALAVSAVAELARSRALEAERRRREADLAAAMARELLLGEDTERALGSTARRIAEALGLSAAAIVTAPLAELDPAELARRLVIPLRPVPGAADSPGRDGETVGALLVPLDVSPDTVLRLTDRLAPTLAALVAIAERRDALQAQRVQTEALRRSDDIKTALLRAVSHDLRTPLTSVVAAGHALGSASLEATERAELSESVVSEATRLADLVDKLLDLSRLQAGAAPPRADWVSAEELITSAAESGLREPLRYTLTVDPDVPEIRADAAQLERAVANLLENARRYSGGQAVHVHVRSARAEDGGEQVLISIVDRGPGIPPAEQARIFEPFYRVPATGARAGGRDDAPAPPGVGSGLGLAIVKGFVEANGGTITVSSLPGQGTSFTIALPVSKEPAPDPAGAGAGR
ncbi:MAG TPA: ATP-binding protein [Solirubrobacteraceae bacterium]|nr:ATP-binding protein [Solirubrobacteraceae bacterium]